MHGLNRILYRGNTTYTGLAPDPQVTFYPYKMVDARKIVHQNIGGEGRTPQLTIKAISPNDKKFCEALLIDQVVMRYAEGIWTGDSAKKKVKDWVNRGTEMKPEMGMLLCHRDADRPVGVLEIRPYQEDGMEVSMLLLAVREKEFGYGQQVGEWLKLLVLALQAEKMQLWGKPIHRVIAFINPEDKRTQAIATKMGMIKSGENRRGREGYTVDIIKKEVIEAPKEVAPPPSLCSRIVSWVAERLGYLDG